MFDIDIPAVNAAEALNRLADQTGSVMLFSYDLARARKANAVRGRYTLLEGLELLLRETGLSGGLSDKRVVIIAADGNVPGGKGESVKKRRLLAALIAAVLGSTAGEGRADQTEQNVHVEEIIVTAQKREERLQDVPVPVTALAASKLVEENLVRLQDYYNRVPGLNLATGNRGELFVSIRGLTTGWYTSPTVGTVVDDVPFGSSTGITGGAPDIDPNELRSVEVLRGPQGTLYGASSLGGLIKYVTIDPSTDGWSGGLQAGFNDVASGNRVGYETRGNINAPVSETFAVRLSGYARRDPGFIDNIRLNGGGIRDEDVNEVDAYGGRVSALWAPSDSFSIKLGAMLQHSEMDGNSYASVGTGLGDLEQTTLVGTGESIRDTKVYSATIRARAAGMDFTSVTGYADGKITGALDLSSFNGFANPSPVSIFGVSGLRYVEQNITEKFSQEFRLVTPIGERIEWLAGAFYTKERFSNGPNLNYATNPVTADAVGVWGEVLNKTSYEEKAFFTDLTFKFTDRFDTQIGGRYGRAAARNRLNRTSGYQATAFFGRDPFLVAPVSQEDDSVTYMLAPRFRMSPDLMIYARVASGYRPGGPNRTFAAQFNAPPTFAPDETQNYEIGVKGNAFDNALTFDLSAYRIDWKDVQLTVAFSGGSYISNAGEARSEGVELSGEYRADFGLTVAGWLSYNDAVLTRDFPSGSSVRGREGDRLPFSSRYSGNFSLDQEFQITNGMKASIGGTVVHVGDRLDNFVGPLVPVRKELPRYTQLDLRSSLIFDDWRATLYAKNVTDRRGTLQGNPTVVPAGIIFIQPRTLGLALSRDF